MTFGEQAGPAKRYGWWWIGGGELLMNEVFFRIVLHQLSVGGEEEGQI